MIIDAILLGAGRGRRFATGPNGALPKQFQLLRDIPVFIHALNALGDLEHIRQLVVVVPREFKSVAEQQIETFGVSLKQHFKIQVVVGGERRQDSSRIALEAIEENPPTRVVIHDASRPVISRELLSRVSTSLLDRAYGAWIPIVPVIETLKKIENHQVVETLSRDRVYRVQTPQVFEYSVIRSLTERAKDLPITEFTDDASLCEYYGIPVGVFEGDVQNIKLTYDFDLELLRSIVDSKEKPCELVLDTTSTV